MIFRLKLHPDCVCAALTGIEVDAIRQGESLMLNYVLAGDIDALSIPSAAVAARRDDLWQRTCCEAFVGARGSNGYREFNFSPSTEWAAYRFDGYRSGMTPVDEIRRIPISVEQTRDRLSLSTAIRQNESSLRLALSVVVEDRNGDKSYWAIQHAPGKPDFHHTAGFVDFPNTP